jgi:hypothetical protein
MHCFCSLKVGVISNLEKSLPIINYYFAVCLTVVELHAVIEALALTNINKHFVYKAVKIRALVLVEAMTNIF